MEEQKKLNFIRHASPPASRKYIFKVVFYVVFLSALLYMIFSQTKQKKAIEIEGVTVELGE